MPFIEGETEAPEGHGLPSTLEGACVLPAAPGYFPVSVHLARR